MFRGRGRFQGVPRPWTGGAPCDTLAPVDLTFVGEIWYWRGPAPFHFVTVPQDECAVLADLAPTVTYGWGMIPAAVTVGGTRITTSLWPRDGGYVVPLKAALRGPERLEVGDVVQLRLTVG